MVKWMVIDKVYYYTLDSIYRRQQPDRAGPIHEFRKGSLFSGQLPPPQKLFPGRFGPGSGDTEVGVQRQREGVIIIIINIPSLVHDVADCSLERSQLASSICQKFHLHSRIDGSTTLPLPSILFSRKDDAPPWYDSICSIGDVIWKLLPTLHLHLFYTEDKNLQVGEFFIHGEIQKTDIWICFYWQFVSSFKIPVLGKRWTMKFKVPWMHGLNF